MTTPKHLKAGDTIGIAAPARFINSDELNYSVSIFESWGLNVMPAPNILLQKHQYAGSDNERIKGMQQLLDDNNIRAVVCARGGYGSMRIIDQIDFSTFLKNPKWIAGYSDITVFHNHIQQNYGIETIHSSMPVNFSNNTPEALLSLKNAFFGETPSFVFEQHPFNKTADCEGILCGGNLSMIYALSGSVSDIDTTGKILFIEDLEEYLYHIDRMLLQLKRSGKLSKLSGLIVGGMNNMNDNSIPFGKTAYEIISEHVSEFDYPVFFGFPAGHISNNKALVMGRKAKLSASENLVCFEQPIN